MPFATIVKYMHGERVWKFVQFDVRLSGFNALPDFMHPIRIVQISHIDFYQSPDPMIDLKVFDYRHFTHGFMTIKVV